MFDIKNKAVEAMLKTLIQSVGIDPNMLLKNLADFQGYVVQWLNGASNRINNLEMEIRAARNEVSETNQKLDLILSQLGVENVGHTESAVARIEHTVAESSDVESN